MALDAGPVSRGTASMRTKDVAFKKTTSHVSSMMQEAVVALKHANTTAPQPTTRKEPDCDEEDELLSRALGRAPATSSSSSAPSPRSHRRQLALNRRQKVTLSGVSILHRLPVYGRYDGRPVKGRHVGSPIENLWIVLLHC